VRNPLMTEDDRTGHSSIAEADGVASLPATPGPVPRRTRRLFRRRPRRRKIRWLRVFLIGVPLAFLALFSFVFGAVLAFVPKVSGLQHEIQVKFSNRGNGGNSVVYASDGKTQLGILTAHNEFFLPPKDIPPIMAHAIVAIEDKRFYTEPGIDIRGIARAFVADVFGGGTQGASTITEQFVKNALGQQYHRSVLEKFYEAAIAFQLAHRWSKPQILADYLNTAYFGSGAYGVEAAARAYFGNDPQSNLYRCGQTPNSKDPKSLCVTNLTPDEAALLAALVNAPTKFNGLENSGLAQDRRNLVLRAMAAQGYLNAPELTAALQATVPPAGSVLPPNQEDSNKSAGYFVSWVADTLTKHLGFGTKAKGKDVYTGGYKIVTTLNSQLQDAAQAIVNHTLPPGSGGPAAAVVAIDNTTGEVRAMVGGYNFNKNAFNLATQGERQPGSAWKVFDLAAALDHGFTRDTGVLSDPWTYRDPAEPAFGAFSIRNDEGGYYGAKIPLWDALAVSDNTVFAHVGLSPSVGTRLIAAYAHNLGITTTISINPSMVIGGLAIGVTPLDMAHAYETIANYGRLTSGTLVSDSCAGDAPDGNPKLYQWEDIQPAPGTCPGPVGIQSILRGNQAVLTNHTNYRQALDYGTDQTEVSMMHGVLTIGTAQSAQIPGLSAWGKTGTTSNYADAWFVGSTPKDGKAPGQTIAVWVGYPNGSKSMAKDYGGKPVYGGTYPALIWKAYVEAMLRYYNSGSTGITNSTPATTPTYTPPSVSTATPTVGSTAPATQSTGVTGAPATGTTTPATGATTATQGPASTVTGGGGSTSTTPTPPSTTPTTSTPPSTSTGGGVVAPGSGTGP
jgi:penicillin-binding protein 1A